MTDRYALVSGLIAQLPESGTWTQAGRDRWMAAFTAMLDLVVMVTPPAGPVIASVPPPAVGPSPVDAQARFFIDGVPFPCPVTFPAGGVKPSPVLQSSAQLCELVDAPEIWKVVTFDGGGESAVYVEPGTMLEVAAGDRFTTKGPGAQ